MSVAGLVGGHLGAPQQWGSVPAVRLAVLQRAPVQLHVPHPQRLLLSVRGSRVIHQVHPDMADLWWGQQGDLAGNIACLIDTAQKYFSAEILKFILHGKELSYHFYSFYFTCIIGQSPFCSFFTHKDLDCSWGSSQKYAASNF